MTYKDMTFCASPDCKNECGRQLPEHERKQIPEWQPVSMAYFCGKPEDQQ